MGAIEWKTSNPCVQITAFDQAERDPFTDGILLTLLAEGLFRFFGAEELIRFPEHTARFVRLRIISNVGTECGRPEYENRRVSMAELTLYRK